MRRLSIIAVRNVLRNKRRSLFSAMAMIIGVAFVVFLNGFFNGFIGVVIRESVEGRTGALQIHHRGFLTAQSDPLKLDMPSDPAFVARIRAVPGVTAIAPRINFEGLLNNGSVANVIVGLGVDPREEYVVCPWRKGVEVDGSLSPDATDQMLVGAELAESMELAPGASVTLLSATQRGASNALDASVKGRIDSPVPFASKRSLVVPLAFAQSLLKMPGRVTEYAVAIDRLDDAELVKQRLQTALGAEFEVHTWDERDTNAATFVGRLRAIVTLVTSVLFVLMLTFIVNAMLAAVYERVREIGTMLAVGVRRSQVLRMFLVEAMTLGLAASVLGSLLGTAAVLYFGHHGIVLQPPGTKPATLYPFVSFASLSFAIFVSVAGAVLAALYPAFKASRLRPVEALRAV